MSIFLLKPSMIALFKRFKLYSFVTVCILFFLGSVPSYAQGLVYPVIVNTTLRAPYSLNLADYADPSYDRVLINLHLTDLTKVNYPVKLRLVIRSEGGVNLSTYTNQEVGPIYLNGGQSTTLTGADVNGLFNPDKLQFTGMSIQQYRQNAALPEGLYQFQFDVIDYHTGVTISNTNIGYAMAWLILNDPPLINLPDKNSTIVPQPQQNIFFQWTPRHTGSPNSSFTTVYDLQLVEIYPASRNENDAMLTSPLIFEKTLYSTSYNYTLADPYLFPDKSYAFRVRAHDVEGKDYFKNQGYSEVYRFYYGGPCVTPANAQVSDIDGSSVLVSWDREMTHNTTTIQYQAKSTTSWKSMISYSNSEIIDGLTPGTTYEFQLQGACTNNTSAFTNQVEFTTMGLSSAKPCDLPLKESVTATAITLSDVNISWVTQSWFTDYKFDYRELGTATFTEVVSSTPSVVLSGLDADKIYEYQIAYHCSTDVWIQGQSNTFKITVPATVLNPGAGTGTCLPPLDITQSVNPDLSVSISWPKDKDVTSYTVYWRENLPAATWDSITVSATQAQLLNLKSGSEYEYQIKAICKSGGLSIASKSAFFTVSSTATARISSSSCIIPKLLPHTPISSSDMKLQWQADPTNTGFVVEYRVKGTSGWLASTCSTPYQLISNLTAGTLYEYRVYAFCGLLSSDYSSIDTFSTVSNPAKSFVCGSNQPTFNITNKNPIPVLNVGDKFTAADFVLQITSLTSSSPFNGEATALVPYLGSTPYVFSLVNVSINELGQMFDGSITSK